MQGLLNLVPKDWIKNRPRSEFCMISDERFLEIDFNIDQKTSALQLNL